LFDICYERLTDKDFNGERLPLASVCRNLDALRFACANNDAKIYTKRRNEVKRKQLIVENEFAQVLSNQGESDNSYNPATLKLAIYAILAHHYPSGIVRLLESIFRYQAESTKVKKGERAVLINNVFKECFKEKGTYRLYLENIFNSSRISNQESEEELNKQKDFIILAITRYLQTSPSKSEKDKLLCSIKEALVPRSAESSKKIYYTSLCEFIQKVKMNSEMSYPKDVSGFLKGLDRHDLISINQSPTKTHPEAPVSPPSKGTSTLGGSPNRHSSLWAHPVGEGAVVCEVESDDDQITPIGVPVVQEVPKEITSTDPVISLTQ
jgi:hypothetical protein